MKIVTDSAAEFTATELADLGITQMPLWIQFPDGEVSSTDIGPDRFYQRLEAMRPAIPTTAQPSSGSFAEAYRAIAAEDKDILSIHISSGLSGTLDSARLAAEQTRKEANVTLFDTLTLSGGQRFMVTAAALAARQGWSLAAIEKRLTELRARTEVFFTLETIEYLARGGRIGRVQGLAGMLLHIKPVIGVDHRDGKYNNIGRARTMPKALETIAHQLQHVYDDTPVWVNLMHGQLASQAEELARIVRDQMNVARVDTLRIAPVLGVHTGPGVVGAAVAPMALLADLL